MARRPCLDCPNLAEPGNGRCASCQAARERAKWARNPNRDPAYRKIRAEIADALPVPCALCGDPIVHIGHGSTALTLDHIVPWSAGGGNERTNLRPTHKRCNSSRGRGQ